MLALMINLVLAALMVNGYNIGALLMMFVGLVILFANVYAILKALGLGPDHIAYKILYVGSLVMLLVIVFGFFFGSVHVST